MILLFIRQFKRQALFYSIFLILLAWCKTYGQDVTIDMIKEAYAQFEFTKVITLADQALTTDPTPSEEDRVQIYTYLAYAYIELGENDKAKENFEEALTLDPTLTLDPVFVSPKIIAIFSEVKASVEASKEEIEEEPEQLIPPIFEKDKRFGAAWRSLVLPGWGQLYKGQKKKAIAIFALQTISIGATLYSHFKMEQAHDEYLKARDPDTIESRYDRYNSYSKMRNYLVVVTAAVWMYSHIDAAVSQPIQEISEEKGTSLIPRITPTSFTLTYSVTF